mgnify:CR=1 FL=1
METVELGIGLPRLDAIATSARRAETLDVDEFASLARALVLLIGPDAIP